MYSKWINDNYEFLEKWSKRWARDNWSDLLSIFTIYLEANWEKFSKIPDTDERLRFTQTFFKNSTMWQNSRFSKEILINNLPEQLDIIDELQEDMNDVKAETTREDIKEWLVDVYNNYSEENAIIIIKMRQIYLRLDTYEKVFYDLYFTNMMSLRQIGLKLGIPHSSCWGMLNSLREKIKKEYYGINN